MPLVMRKLGLIQFFSWFAFFTMWTMATPALTEHVFKASKPIATEYNLQVDDEALNYKEADKKYNQAADNVGATMGTYGLSSMAFALLFTLYTSRRTINRKYVHMASLIVGGLGFLLMYFASNSLHLHFCFALIGVAWGSILSLPYAMLSASIDSRKMGIFMGLFNMFIVFPQIIAALGGINFLYKNIFGEATINTMILAGTCLIIAGLTNFWIKNKKAIRYTPEELTN